MVIFLQAIISIIIGALVLGVIIAAIIGFKLYCEYLMNKFTFDYKGGFKNFAIKELPMWDLEDYVITITLGFIAIFLCFITGLLILFS